MELALDVRYLKVRHLEFILALKVKGGLLQTRKEHRVFAMTI
jgi:hypothetical protein